MSKIIFLSHNETDHTLTFAIDGRRYEYQMPTPLACDNALYITRVASVKSGFNYAKKFGKLMREPAH